MGRYTLLLALCACGGAEQMLDSGDVGPADPSGLDTAGGSRNHTVFVDLLPSLRQTSYDEDATFFALDQTVVLQSQSEDQGFDLGQVALVPPVVQSGKIVAFRVNPSVAQFPGEEVSVEGFVRIHRPDTVQSYGARSNVDGDFEAWALPGAGYRLEVVPDDPLLPMYTADWTVSDPPDPISLDLGPGVPIYGVVSSASGSVVGARIHVVDPFGAVSATALSDEFGLYQIRVQTPGSGTTGTWTLVCEGRGSGKDPTLTYPNLAVDQDGLNFDIAYPTDLVASSIGGQVQDLDEEPAIGAIVRLTAESLVGFDDLEPGVTASWSTDVYVSDIGFLSPAPPGDYTLEVLPPDTDDGDALSPWRLSAVPVGVEEATTSTIQLGPLVEVSGTVRGPGGGLALAYVTCQEIGFEGRRTSTYTGERGGYTLELPTVPVICEVQPPGSNLELAAGYTDIDPSKVASLDFTLGTGQTIQGQLTSGTGAQASAQVQVRDQAGRILGYRLTDADGRFYLPVDLATAE